MHSSPFGLVLVYIVLCYIVSERVQSFVSFRYITAFVIVSALIKWLELLDVIASMRIVFIKWIVVLFWSGCHTAITIQLSPDIGLVYSYVIKYCIVSELILYIVSDLIKWIVSLFMCFAYRYVAIAIPRIIDSGSVFLCVVQYCIVSELIQSIVAWYVCCYIDSVYIVFDVSKQNVSLYWIVVCNIMCRMAVAMVDVLILLSNDPVICTIEKEDVTFAKMVAAICEGMSDKSEEATETMYKIGASKATYFVACIEALGKWIVSLFMCCAYRYVDTAILRIIDSGSVFLCVVQYRIVSEPIQSIVAWYVCCYIDSVYIVFNFSKQNVSMYCIVVMPRMAVWNPHKEAQREYEVCETMRLTQAERSLGGDAQDRCADGDPLRGLQRDAEQARDGREGEDRGGEVPGEGERRAEIDRFATENTMNMCSFENIGKEAHTRLVLPTLEVPRWDMAPLRSTILLAMLTILRHACQRICVVRTETPTIFSVKWGVIWNGARFARLAGRRGDRERLSATSKMR